MTRALGLIVGLILVIAGPAWAEPQDTANDISRAMMSPYCPGVTLHDCPSESARELRTLIAAWAEDGMDKEQIWQRLEDEFGSDIRATPSAEGSGLGAWVLPIAAAVVGLALAAVLAFRWSRRPAKNRPEAPVTAEQRRRLDVELAAFRERQG